MANRNLTNLRKKHLYIQRRWDRLEPAVARLRTSLDETNAAIQVLDPQLPLPPRRHKPTQHFARGELPRIVREIMWGQGPMAVRVIALAALARKGVTLPGPGTMRHTRKCVRGILGTWERKGKAQTVGRNKGTRRVLTNAITES